MRCLARASPVYLVFRLTSSCVCTTASDVWHEPYIFGQQIPGRNLWPKVMLSSIIASRPQTTVNPPMPTFAQMLTVVVAYSSQEFARRRAHWVEK